MTTPVLGYTTPDFLKKVQKASSDIFRHFKKPKSLFSEETSADASATFDQS